MEPKARYLNVKLVLGLVTLVVGLLAANLALFHWVERTGFYYLLGNYARYVCAYGGFAAMIFGAMLINDYWVLRNVWKGEYLESFLQYAADHELVLSSEEKEKKKVVDRERKNRRKTIAATSIAVFVFMLCPIVVSSLVSYTATVTITPQSHQWLSGWDKCVKITIDHNDIIDTLSDFPVLVYLSNSSGRNNDNVTFIFDELQSDANRKKIAVTTSDGVSQCYVEIERWDDPNEQAWLWVKVPSISNTTDTELYLYYDKDHVDNTVYVGDTGSTTAQNVWSNSFSGVWHLNGDFQDSTSNNHDGTNVGSLDAAGMTARGREFNPDDGEDHLEFGDWNVTGNKITLQTWVKCDDFGQDDPRFLTKALSGSADQHVFMLGLSGSGERYLRARIRTGTTTTTLIAGTGGDLTANTWYLVAVTYDGDDSPENIKLFRNGVEPTSYSSGSQSRTGALVQNTWPIWAGDNLNTPGYGEADGLLDEIRISNVARSAAWIRASYESERDDLVDFGSEEISAGWGDYSSELLVNIGGEFGNTTGWTATGPNAASFVAGYDCPSGSAGPHTGSYAFYWNNPSSSSDWAYQEVDLSSWLSEIQAGEAQIMAKGWLVCSEYHVPPWDIVRMKVVFYDNSSQEISSDTYDTGERGDLQDWTEFGIENYTIPTNAVKVRTWFQTFENNWDAGNADDFTVKVRTYIN